MDDIRHHTPHLKIHLLGDFNGFVGIIGRKEEEPLSLFLYMLHGEFPVEHRDDHAFPRHFQRAIDDQEITRLDTRAGHGFAFDTEQERSRRIADQVLGEVDLFFDKIISRTRETGRDFGQK